MATFGLACEGITDQITIENILFGLFDDIDEDDIRYLQPQDMTDQKTFGGWTSLLNYLGCLRFKQDLGAVNYLIIQVDTDIAEQIGFDVPLTYNNEPLSTPDIVKSVIERLIKAIDNDASKKSIYQDVAHKIIFAISVSSLECWLYNYYVKDLNKLNTTNNCFDKLLNELKKDKKKPSLVKKKDIYDALSEPLMKKKNIDKLYDKDKSFSLFIDRLREVSF